MASAARQTPPATPRGLRPVEEVQYAPGRLIRIAQQVHVRLWAATVGSAITSPQYAVLITIAAEPGLDQSTVAERATLDKVTAAGIVARLARSGLVSRRDDHADRRRYRLKLSKQGQRTLTATTSQVLEVQALLVEPLQTAKNRIALLELLRRVAREEDSPSRAGATRLVELGTHHLEVPNLLQSPGHLIRVAQQVHTRLWSREIDGQLTSPQYAVLDAVAREPGITQATALHRVSVDKATGAEIIKRLVTRGELDRVRHPGDSRMNSLTISAEGMDTLRRTTGAVFHVQEQLIEPLSTDERTQFTSLIAGMARIRKGAEPLLLKEKASDLRGHPGHDLPAATGSDRIAL